MEKKFFFRYILITLVHLHFILFVTVKNLHGLELTFNNFFLQGFNWESHKYNWWNNLETKVPDIAKSGFTSVWLPPPYHSFSPEGYITLR